MIVADVIATALRDAGVRYLFGVPGGGSSLDLIEAARRHGLRFVLTATEAAAAIAAMAQAEITGAPGVCLTGLGPGAASAVNGAACALLDRAPLIVITDAHPASAVDCAHQRLDHRALFAPVVKWSATLSTANVEEAISEAIVRATASPAGAVHLDCPADVAGRAIGTHQSSVGTHQSSVITSRLNGPTDDYRLPTVPVTAARRPPLIAGLGARRHADAIRAFSTSHGVPVMVTYKAKGVVSDRDPRFAGVFTNGSLEQEVMADADLLIAVGLDRVELLPRPWIPSQPIVEIAGHVDAKLRELAAGLAYAEWDAEALLRTIAGQRERLAGRAANAAGSVDTC